MGKYPEFSRQVGKAQEKQIMSMTDPIADFLTRIRNAIQAGHRKVDIPSSNLKKRMAEILYDHKFIRNYILIDDGKQGILRIFLNRKRKIRNLYEDFHNFWGN